MLKIKLRKVKNMSYQDAKLQAYNDMLKEDKREQKAKERKRQAFNNDAINQADIYRFVFGNDFVDTNAVIIKQNNERLA